MYRLIIAVCAIASSAILVRLTGTPPLITALYRQFFCALLIYPFIGEASDVPLSSRDRKLLLASGFFLAIHFATWISSLFLTTVARATLLVDLQPLWASLLGVVFLSERLTYREWIGVAVITGGGMLIGVGARGGDGSTITGDVLALIGGIAGAAYLMIGRKVRMVIPWARYMFAVYSISTVWLFLICVSFTLRIPLPAERDLPWILLMAVGPGILGHGFLNLAIREFKAYAVNAALLGEPVIATVLAYFLFHEAPDAWFFAGAALIFGGLLTIFRKNS